MIKYSAFKIYLKDFKDDDIKFESLEDTYMDLANYAIISLLVKKEEWGNELDY